jgi:hypothetical protein
MKIVYKIIKQVSMDKQSNYLSRAVLHSGAAYLRLCAAAAVRPLFRFVLFVYLHYVLLIQRLTFPGLWQRTRGVQGRFHTYNRYPSLACMTSDAYKVVSDTSGHHHMSEDQQKNKIKQITTMRRKVKSCSKLKCSLLAKPHLITR